LIYSQKENRYLSPVAETPPFDRAVLSCNFAQPVAGRVKALLRVRRAGAWSPFVTMITREDGAFSSVKDGAFEGGSVDVDTLILSGGPKADAWQAAVEPAGGMCPVISLAVSYYLQKDPQVPFDATPSPAWGKVLDVAPRAQGAEHPSIASRICSPTSTAMALEFFGHKVSTAEFAAKAYDRVSDLYGNWAANAAAAGAICGEAFAVHFCSFAEIEREILAGRPVVLSHAWKEGELSNAPIAQTAGHLVLVVGFDARGNPVVNDPAAPVGQGRRVYDRREIHRTWQENASGIVYIFRPRNGPVRVTEAIVK
jgi:uncharacterized protein YvpB